MIGNILLENVSSSSIINYKNINYHCRSRNDKLRNIIINSNNNYLNKNELKSCILNINEENTNISNIEIEGRKIFFYVFLLESENDFCIKIGKTKREFSKRINELKSNTDKGYNCNVFLLDYKFIRAEEDEKEFHITIKNEFKNEYINIFNGKNGDETYKPNKYILLKYLEHIDYEYEQLNKIQNASTTGFSANENFGNSIKYCYDGLCNGLSYLTNGIKNFFVNNHEIILESLDTYQQNQLLMNNIHYIQNHK